ncbi:MAG: hypothetical protein LBT59_07590, partial [Clostridiales bacterium]|jgi:hypothetical protein|nr:hypothetical protein [Clostridiales bacterium]
MLQELMGADGGGRQPADGAGFVGSLDKAMQLVQTLQLFSGADAKVFFGDADPGEPELPTVDDSVDFAKLFDDEIATPSINAMKAALPFVDPSMHRSLGLWIKLMEMQRIFDLTSNGGALVPAAADYGDWRLGMLSAMRPYASPEKKSLIDFIGRMTGLMDTLGRQ